MSGGEEGDAGRADESTSERRSGSGPPRDRLESYADDLFVREDPLLAELRAETEARGFPLIQVPARTGLLLQILVRVTGARRIVEVGTLGGYSALWMARALTDGGRLVTMEKDPARAELAREFVERAGLAEAVDVRQGRAIDLLRKIDGEGTVDLFFLDGDKESYPAYLAEARRLLRPGGLLVADNSFWKGKVLEEPEEGDDATRGIRTFNRSLAEDPNFTATIVPTGDGVMLAVRR